jgi:mannosyltransferase
MVWQFEGPKLYSLHGFACFILKARTKDSPLYALKDVQMSTQNLPAQTRLSGQRSEVQDIQWKPRFEFVVLSLLILFAAALRVYHLGAASLWSDEIFSRYYVDLFGLHYVLSDGLSKETNPPTYYLLLQGWMALWGASEAALRWLSAVASTLCVPVTYFLGRELGGKSRALAGALLCALCPMSVYFAQEARVYALLMLAASVALWAAAVFQRDSRSWKAAFGYLLSATLCLYLHVTGLLFVAACTGAVWLSLLPKGVSARGSRPKWLALNGLVLLLGSPYYLHVFAASQTGVINYVPPAGIHQLVYCLSLVVAGNVTPYPWPAFLLAAAAGIALVVSLCLNPPSGRTSVTLIGIPCLFLALVLVLSIRRPILLPRTLVFMVGPLCLLAGRQVLAAGRARFAVLLSLVAVFGTGLFFQMTAPNSDKEPWREILHTLAPQLAQADLVVLSPVSNPEVLRYYAPQVKNVRLWDAGLPPTIMRAAAEKLHMATITEPEILQSIQAGQSVWVLSHSFDLSRVNELQTRLPATFFREWFCGKVPCVAAAHWQSHP